MHPILFSIGDTDIHFFQVFFPLTLLFGAVASTRRAAREGFNPELILTMLVWTVIGLMVGARFIDVIVHPGTYLADPSRLFNRRQGIVMYGGYLGAMAGTYGYVRYKKHPFLPLMDIAATYFGLGLAIHRTFACFMAGCCYGEPTSLPWGVVFPDGSRPDKVWGAQPLHPTQLYEAFFGLCMFATVMIYREKKRNRIYGELFAIQLAMYGVGRFAIESVRGDVSRGTFGPLSTSQWISVAMIGAAAGLAIYCVRQKRRIRDGRIKPEGVVYRAPATV
ncbi:prolipoprotein diacylglyceryl transferase [bacterium]|nr:prolipoprotein diacylglyceryl transferase [bacterium]